MKTIEKILVGISIVLALSFLAISAFQKSDSVKIGAYNNQYDGIVVEKDVVSSSLATSTTVALTDYATGDLYVDNVLVSTDSTGLAAGTNLEIKVESPTYGLATFFSTAISGLGANKTIDLNTASVAKQHVILRNGERLVANCTTAVCTGDGVAKISVLFKKVTQGAAIQ